MYPNFHHTKIVATVGPSSASAEMIKKLIIAGVDIFRLNFSHSSQDKHRQVIKIIREVSTTSGLEVGILGDLQGPKIRLAELATEQVIHASEKVTITADVKNTGPRILPTSYSKFAQDVKKGQRVLIDDGLIELKVCEIVDEKSVVCEVIHGGVCKSRKGINLPDSKLSISSFTSKDLADLEFIIKNDLDFVALSFVRTAKDIIDFSNTIKRLGGDIPVIAKIEKPDAVEDIDAVINASYGVMIARGDLGVEIPPERVPFEQKRIAQLCNKRGKPVIIATQMLESMITKPIPTRAEASDVANAVVDGADALMLSAETASGLYPLRAVSIMDRIIKAAEEQFILSASSREKNSQPISFEDAPNSNAVCFSAVIMADDLKASLISCITKKGNTALKLARYKPSIPIMAITDSHKTARRLMLSWGVYSVTIDKLDNSRQCLDRVAKIVDSQKWLNKGELVVFVLGLPKFASGSINTIKIQNVTKSDKATFL